MPLAVWLIARTPLPIAAALSWLLSWLWWTAIPVRKKLLDEEARPFIPPLPPGRTGSPAPCPTLGRILR